MQNLPPNRYIPKILEENQKETSFPQHVIKSVQLTAVIAIRTEEARVLGRGVKLNEETSVVVKGQSNIRAPFELFFSAKNTIIPLTVANFCAFTV
jgi:hypothetical protein